MSNQDKILSNLDLELTDIKENIELLILTTKNFLFSSFNDVFNIEIKENAINYKVNNEIFMEFINKRLIYINKTIEQQQSKLSDLKKSI